MTPNNHNNTDEQTPFFKESWQRFKAAKGFAAKRDEFNRFFWPGSNQELMLCISLSPLLGVALIAAAMILTHRN